MIHLDTCTETKIDIGDDFDRYSFGFKEGENFIEKLRNNQVSFHLDDINTAIHNILGSKLGVGEFFVDNYGTLYSTGEYIQIARFLKEEHEILRIFHGKSIPDAHILSSLRSIQELCPTIHENELIKRAELMMKNSICSNNEEGNKYKAKDNIGYFRLPTPLELCLGEKGIGGDRVGIGKSGQLVISTKKGTNSITGICLSYTTQDFEEAFENELKAHYPNARTAIFQALTKKYGNIDNGIMIAPVIGMLPRYASIRSMMRLMRDWGKNLIDLELAELPGMAEMDLSNNFFELCAKQLDISPLPLIDKNGECIRASSNRFDYLSSVVTFRTKNVLSRGTRSINSILPRQDFNLKDNHIS